MIPDAGQIRSIQEGVEQIVLQSSVPLTEHSLLKELERQGLFDWIPATDAALVLFRKHFLIMHVLYRLQVQFQERGAYLHISALAIDLVVREGCESSLLATADSGLRNYYLDLEEFGEVTEAEVVNLLYGFWRRYDGWQTADQACQILGVPQDANWHEVQAAYRRAAATAHPDKGGDAAQFCRIFEAYQSLKFRLKLSG